MDSTISGKAQGSTGLSVQSFLSSSAVYVVICVAVLTYELRGTRSFHSIGPRMFLQWSRDWEDLIALYGADRYFLIRLFHTTIKIFAPLSIVLTTSLLPVDVTAGDSGAVNGLDRLSWANLGSGQTGRLWANAVAATGSMSFVCYVLVLEFRNLIDIRQHCLLQVANLSTAVLVTDIPPEKMTKDGLLAHYAPFKPTGVWIHRGDDTILYTQRRQQETLRRKLETHLTWRFQQVASSAIEKDEKLRSLAAKYQKLGEQVADREKNPRGLPGSSALVQFNEATTAHLVQHVVHSSQLMRMIPHRVQSPDDIVLPNVSLSWKRRLFQGVAVAAFLVGFCLFVSVPIGLTGTLSQISYLAGRIPLVAHLLSSVSGSRWMAVIQGLLPQILLSVIVSVAPRLISALVSHQAHVTFSTQEMSIARYYFLFLYIQIFLVVSLASSLTTVIPEALKHPASVPTILAENIPKSSNYFYSYLMLQCITQCSLSLCRLPDKLWYRISSRLVLRTPRDIWEAHQLSVHWGLIYPVFTNLACIYSAGVTFSIVAPLIVPIGLVAFMIFSLIYCRKYMEQTEGLVETGGLLYWRSLHQLFFGIYTAELSQFGLFMLREAKAQATMILLTVTATAITQYIVSRIYGPLRWHLPVDLLRPTKENTAEPNLGRSSPLIARSIWAPASDITCRYLLRNYGILVSQEGLRYNVDGVSPISGPPSE